MENIQDFHSFLHARNSLKCLIENLLHQILSFIDSQSELLIVVVPGTVRRVEDRHLHLEQTLETFVVNLLDILQSGAQRRLPVPDVGDRSLLSVQPPGELGLAVSDVLQVPAPLHEGVDLREDARPVRQLSDVGVISQG